jgi:putative membrane protein
VIRTLGPRMVAAALARKIGLVVEGIEHLPPHGPVLLAARHYHHLYDGVALVHGVPRGMYLVVALDWAKTRRERRRMELICAIAGWPVALRSENLSETSGAYRPSEALRYNRRALAASVRLLKRGSIVTVFPEGYPTIDPQGRRKPDDETLLAFRPGVLAIAAAAQRAGGARVPIVPAGLHYAKAAPYDITLRLGAPLFVDATTDRAAVLAELNAQVRNLSRA